jgi:ATP-dependent Clp protease ATP-binding subunit ClpC
MRKKLTESLKKTFRPEFINRLDGVVIFRALNKEDIKKIVSLELEKVAERLKDHALTLNASSAAVDLLAERGFDPEMGARPLRRVIVIEIEDALSDKLLAGEFHDGDTIIVGVEDGEIGLQSKVEGESTASQQRSQDDQLREEALSAN